MEDEGFHAIQAQLLDEPPKRLNCALCGNLMRKPLQTCRGEIACTLCYTNQKGDGDICPIDGEQIEPNQIFPDRAKEKEIMSLKCFCHNNKFGCPWQGTIKIVQQHQEGCKYSPVECPVCSEKFPKSTYEQHVKDCLARTHSKECPYSMTGCSFTPSADEDMERHLQSNAYVHSTMFTTFVKQNQFNQEAKFKKLEEKIESLITQLDKEKSTSALLRKKSDDFEAEVQALKVMLTTVMVRVSDLETGSSKTAANVATPNEGKNKSNIDKELDNYQKEVRQLSNTVTNISQNLSDVDLRHQLHENTTYTGVMLWKIDNFEHRFEQAQLGKTTALHSAPAFTDKYGYKFCARLYLNGDGMGKNTHVSLFFVLMKSEFDNLLQWPFTKHVSFTLINQENTDLNVKETFIADVNSSSFKKPVKQMNIASGCPFFVSQEKLRRPGAGFIKDNCFFLEIRVK